MSRDSKMIPALFVAVLFAACGDQPMRQAQDSISGGSELASTGEQGQPQPDRQSDWRDREYGIGVVAYPISETDALSGVIRSRPSESADTVATFGGGRELCYTDRRDCLSLYDRTIEYDYEIAGWAILGFNPDTSWARVSLDPFGVDSVGKGWVSLERTGVRPLLWSDELPEHSLFFLWPDSIRFYGSPDSSRLRDLKLTSFPEPRRYDYVLRPMKRQGHWLQVEVFSPQGGCGIPDSVEPDTAWIRYLSPTSRPRVFYYTRGC